MKIEEFLRKLEEALDVENEKLTIETYLIDLEEYDSLAVLSIIALIDECFNKSLSEQELSDIVTVKDLLQKIGEENFE